MPGVVEKKKNPEVPGGGGRDDFSTMDEVKVFKDEGEDENEPDASESLHADLLEEKSSLINESEHLPRRPLVEYPKFSNPFGMGYLVNPYGAYASNRSPFPPFVSDRLISPPPAHMGSLPYERPPFPPSPYHPAMHPQFSPYGSLGLEHLGAWQASMYQQQQRAPYSLPLSSAFPRFPAHEGLLPPHLLPPHHLPAVRPEHEHHLPGLVRPDVKDEYPAKQGPHIKKPLNAFMLYMKEMRPVVQAECTLKESAAINQILGRRWHGLAREEQAVYYEKAREERQRHQQLYPNWNARDNYRAGQKPKKRKRDKTDDPAANIKKCRARYGVEQQDLWCKPCRRKKKCIRVQMYLAGHSEQEIDDTCAAGGDGAEVAATSPGSGGGSPQSQEGSEEYNDQSIPSPALSIPSLNSPSSFPTSPLTPGGTSQEWQKVGESYKPPVGYRQAVGSDPRESSHPLSISSMTGSMWKGGWNNS